VRGYSALTTGLALLPEAGVVAFSAFLSGRVTGRVGPRLPMVIGLAAGGIGLLALVLVGATTAYVVIGVILLAIGFGTSFTMPAMTAAVMEAAPPARASPRPCSTPAARWAGCSAWRCWACW
jgi:DHA2 family methylenomycin A resistance protein-like MFS transporter